MPQVQSINSPYVNTNPDYDNGFQDGQRFAELNLFKWGNYHLLSTDIDPNQCDEILVDAYCKDQVVFVPLKTGYWNPVEPDYDREGTKICKGGGYCSECQKYSRIKSRFCPECGSWNLRSDMRE